MNISATKLQVTPETKKYLVVQNSHILLQLSNSLFEMKSKQLLIFKKRKTTTIIFSVNISSKQ